MITSVQCLNSVLNVKAVVAAFNQEKALVGAFSMITNLRMELFEALLSTQITVALFTNCATLLPADNFAFVGVLFVVTGCLCHLQEYAFR